MSHDLFKAVNTERRAADRRTSDRRTEQDDMANGHQERSGIDRRVSPAVGEYAIQQIPPLAAEIARLREFNKELLAALTNLALEARHYHHTGGGGTHLIDSIYRAEAAIAKAQPVEWQPHLPDPDPEYRK